MIQMIQMMMVLDIGNRKTLITYHIVCTSDNIPTTLYRREHVVDLTHHTG
jgi:hypothetical protein